MWVLILGTLPGAAALGAAMPSRIRVLIECIPFLDAKLETVSGSKVLGIFERGRLT